MMGFWRSLRAGPSSLRDEASISVESSPKASVPIADEVPAMSPARLLAKSMTDCETRGEWVRDDAPLAPMMGGISVRYVNAQRDLYVSRYVYYGVYSTRESISTPFTLNKAEEEIVKLAIVAFEQREDEDRQAAALARLTAPREGLKPVRGETPKSGSTPKARKPDPKGRAQ